MGHGIFMRFRDVHKLLGDNLDAYTVRKFLSSNQEIGRIHPFYTNKGSKALYRRNEIEAIVNETDSHNKP